MTSTSTSAGKLYGGTAVLIIGFMSPLLIPVVTSSNLSTGMKATLSGLLAFGIPELFMLIAIGLMGKQGYEFLKSKLFRYLRRFTPPNTVSRTRYRVGLILFFMPLMLAWIHPYLSHYFAFLQGLSMWFYIAGDALFFASFFVLGGDFWDKFSGLFKHKTKTSSL